MVTRWTPFDEALSLRDLMSRMIETSFGQAGQAGQGEWHPFPLNVYGRGDDLVVEALLPGVSQEDVQVSVDRGVLTIAARRQGHQPENGQGHQPEDGQGQATWYLREAPGGQFRRAISLPFPVDADQAGASQANGVLTLTLPKAEAARPKQIKITAGAPEAIEAAAQEPAGGRPGGRSGRGE